MKTRKTLFTLFVVLSLAACGGGKWHTHDAYTRPTQAGGTAAVYFLLHNATDVDDALVGGVSDVATSVEIHQSSTGDDLDGMVATGEMDHEHEEGEAEHEHNEGEEHEHEGMEEQPMSEMEMMDMANIGSMVHLDRLDIAAGHEVEFEPGSYHLMLIGLTRELTAGETFELTLQFEHAPDLTIEVSVVAP